MKKARIKNEVPESHFRVALKEFEVIVCSLPREQAFELMSYTANYFKLKHVKTILPPSVSVEVAADILCDEIESWLKRKIFNSAIKKVDAWISLVQIVNESVKI